MLKDLWSGTWEQDNLLERKQKKPNLTRVKMLKLAILIVRLRYSYRKKNYEAQLLTNQMWNDEIEKKIN